MSAESVLTKSQVKKYGPKPITGYGADGQITATARFDDQCGNGHNTFSLTADVTTFASLRKGDIEAGGCLHDEIAQHFPELAPFIKWHLVGTDGPMHYIANTRYHASDRDHRGLLKGEKVQLRNGRSKLPVWERVVRNAAGEVVKIGYTDWRDSEEKPTETLTIGWEPVWVEGEGKERELDYARGSAVWPEATEEELTTPGLQERLEARLPALMAEFRAAVEALGFTWWVSE